MLYVLTPNQTMYSMYCKKHNLSFLDTRFISSPRSLLGLSRGTDVYVVQMGKGTVSVDNAFASSGYESLALRKAQTEKWLNLIYIDFETSPYEVAKL